MAQPQQPQQPAAAAAGGKLPAGTPDPLAAVPVRVPALPPINAATRAIMARIANERAADADAELTDPRPDAATRDERRAASRRGRRRPR